MIPIQKNEATATYRRIPILIYSDTDHVTGWAGSVTGVKAQLSFNGGAESASTADIVRVAGALHYVELTQAESNTADGLVTARVAAAAGRDEGQGAAYIQNFDPRAAGDSKADIRAEIDLNSTMLAGIRVDTEDLQARVPAALVGGRIDASVGAMAAGVITDAAHATEPELAALPGTAAVSPYKMLRYLYQRFRNKRTVTATEDRMFKADGSTVIAAATLSDDTTTFTKGADA